jgi:ADP-ribosylglycohydrolase
MRIAPVLLPHMRRPTAALWADAALAAMVTHNDPASNAACVAFVHLLWETLRQDTPPPTGWWLRTFCAVARQVEGAACYRPRDPRVAYAHEGPVSAFAERVVGEALERQLSTRDACESWHSGAYLLETVPCVLYLLEMCGHDPEWAIVRAVNDTKDNDTIAAIVGAAVGALHGKRALPNRWLEGLLGRTTADDDGRIFALIDEARDRFW